MSIKSKLAALALATVTIAGGLAATTQTADAKWKGHHWGAAGVGFAAGALIGAAAANAYAPGYYAYGGYSCRWVPQYNQFGYYIGKTKVCGYY